MSIVNDGEQGEDGAKLGQGEMMCAIIIQYVQQLGSQVEKHSKQISSLSEEKNRLREEGKELKAHLDTLMACMHDMQAESEGHNGVKTFSRGNAGFSKIEVANRFRQLQPKIPVSQGANLLSLPQTIQAILQSCSRQQNNPKRSLSELMDLYQVDKQNKTQRTDFNKSPKYSEDFEFQSGVKKFADSKNLDTEIFKIKPQVSEEALIQNETKFILQQSVFGLQNSGQNEDNCFTDNPSSSSTGPNQMDSFQYMRKQKRMVWSQELHKKFEEAIEALGGPWISTPTQILKQMNIPRLTLGQIKSHLQKHRHKQQLLEGDLSRNNNIIIHSSSQYPNIEVKNEINND